MTPTVESSPGTTQFPSSALSSPRKIQAQERALRISPLTMDVRAGNSTLGSLESWYGDKDKLDCLNDLTFVTGLAPTSGPGDSIEFSFSDQYQSPVELFGFGAPTTTIAPIPRAAAPHTLIPATANHYSSIHGNHAMDLNTHTLHQGFYGIPLPSAEENRIKATLCSPNRSGIANLETNNNSQPLRCGWKDCGYNGTFGRKAELMRHIASKHVDPHSHRCRGCRKVFNRRDNLDEHVQRVHMQHSKHSLQRARYF